MKVLEMPDPEPPVQAQLPAPASLVYPVFVPAPPTALPPVQPPQPSKPPTVQPFPPPSFQPWESPNTFQPTAPPSFQSPTTHQPAQPLTPSQPHQPILSYGGFRGRSLYASHRGQSVYRGAPRGRANTWQRGARGRSRGGYRNMTLVVNHSTAEVPATAPADQVAISNPKVAPNEAPSVIDGPNSTRDVAPAPATASLPNDKFIASVSKGGMSLVNTRVYSSETYQSQLARINEARALLLERRKQKLAQEKKQRSMHAIQTKVSKAKVKYDDCNRVQFGDEIFAITRGGNKLVPISIRTYELLEAVKVLKSREVVPKRFTADLYDEQTEAKEEDVDVQIIPGVTKHDLTALKNKICYGTRSYKRLKNGCLKIQGKPIMHIEKCKYFTRTGICTNGNTCKFSHNPEQIALCQAFLKASCTDYNCCLSHIAVPENTPSCKYFLLGNCTNPNCMYVHNAVDFSHPRVCRSFAIGGWCDQATLCDMIHSFECPDFQEPGGVCPRGRNCKLSHVVRGVVPSRGNPNRATSFRQQQLSKNGASLDLLLTTDTSGDTALDTFNEKDKVTLILTDSDFSSDEEENGDDDSDIDFDADFIQF
ncbi:hypothetical protein BABINDRAFT_162857 [Babjeviella inositovora NRRL Y-12698]|uniref:C3H1-type domain-containing protein n=1 Tax=Babjeviella inositovora NRRL Y-12698 TaxID=984486 RepID=A0A1E3QKF3_9ASCO|nr:uncharacterized protein BABINDRAFT_162857 [Babjeviella inositovora NRRL Y-12698]ODQ78186.1 hypothetical protein BABINDRAFT_162857 [Babjeviella inositovora NRRL Y-12698]